MNTRSIVLEKLRKHPQMSGRSLHQILKAHKIRLSGSAFYLMMSKMVDEGLVSFVDETVVIDGVRIKRRHFKLNDK